MNIDAFPAIDYISQFEGLYIYPKEENRACRHWQTGESASGGFISFDKKQPQKVTEWQISFSHKISRILPTDHKQDRQSIPPFYINNLVADLSPYIYETVSISETIINFSCTYKQKTVGSSVFV